MSRYRLLPSPAQEAVLRDHCAHARLVWNLAVEQHSHWHHGRASAPGHPTHLPIPLHSRGGGGGTRPVNREPHLLLRSA